MISSKALTIVITSNPTSILKSTYPINHFYQILDDFCDFK